jgi:hypothetical protein
MEIEKFLKNLRQQKYSAKIYMKTCCSVLTNETFLVGMLTVPELKNFLPFMESGDLFIHPLATSTVEPWFTNLIKSLMPFVTQNVHKLKLFFS